jgi:hypothetical protein
MRAQPDGLAFWLPTKAAFLALGNVLTPRQQQKLHANLCGLAQRRAEKNDLRSAHFLYELAGCEYVEEEKQKKPELKLIVDNEK